jgi:type III restriction enzyme
VVTKPQAKQRPVAEDSEELRTVHHGHLSLFSNFDEHGNRLARPNTLLIDSKQLESGEALDDDFRRAAALEIEGRRSIASPVANMEFASTSRRT